MGKTIKVMVKREKLSSGDSTSSIGPEKTNNTAITSCSSNAVETIEVKIKLSKQLLIFLYKMYISLVPFYTGNISSKQS